uniref:Photosystem II reaction center Psb28 protein n=1 Tax=Climaconeis cf. scalaris TaxID=2846828 RepID=A0A8F8SPY8_9STRA|nr:W protein of photosystem II [Climaconeis cf. scalaris]QYB19378.1 W protein of photosystem II [Climaconeis cf. scalaris]
MSKNRTIQTKIQFIRGIDEHVLPSVYLTRSRDGSTGTATFKFKKAAILEKTPGNDGEITGMYLIDEEGILETRVVSIRFTKGKPKTIEAIYIMQSRKDWVRFIRFMERYNKRNGLEFIKY